MGGFQHQELDLHGSTKVHLLSADLDSIRDRSAPELYSAISDDEIQRAHRFHHDRDRDRFLASRYFLRSVLGEYSGLKPEAIEFEFNRFGKPRLKKNPLSFNLSHSGPYATVAIAEIVCLGIDIETRMTPETANEVAPRVLGAQELKRWRAGTSADREHSFTRYWTLKEAVLKAFGEGLSQDPRGIELDLEGPKAQIIRLPGAFGSVENWSIMEIDKEGNFPRIALAMIK